MECGDSKGSMIAGWTDKQWALVRRAWKPSWVLRSCLPPPGSVVLLLLVEGTPGAGAAGRLRGGGWGSQSPEPVLQHFPASLLDVRKCFFVFQNTSSPCELAGEARGCVHGACGCLYRYCLNPSSSFYCHRLPAGRDSLMRSNACYF